VHKNLAENIA